MSWTISSKKMPIPESTRILNYYVHSDTVVRLGNNSAFIEGGFYYHEHLFASSGFPILDQIDGSFAVAIFNPDCVLCACDCSCTRNIYYYQNSGFWVVSSSLERIVECLANNNCLKMEANYLSTYLYFGNSHDITPYKGVQKLLCGCVLKITNELKILPYIDFDSILHKAETVISNKDSAEYCLSILKKSCVEIEKQYKPQKSVIEISGGIDSAILAGLFCSVSDLAESRITGYSYNYKHQFIGNEVKFMCAVAQKNKITDHVITNLRYDSIKLCDTIYIGCPDTAMLNAGLFEMTKKLFTNTDIILSGQGGDGCIGDEYDIFIKDGNPLVQSYYDSLYQEKFILSTLKTKVISPCFLGNIVPWLTFSNTPIKPLWTQRRIEQVANNAINNTYKRLGKYISNAACKKVLIDYMAYNGLQSDDYYRCVSFYPYLTRDMVVLGRVFNNWFCDKQNYRARIKKVIGAYVPSSVLNRRGKSRMDKVYANAIALNMNIYQKIVEETKLFAYLPIDRLLINKELKRITTGESCDLTYSLRLLSLIVWFDQLHNAYPTMDII